MITVKNDGSTKLETSSRKTYPQDVGSRYTALRYVTADLKDFGKAIFFS